MMKKRVYAGTYAESGSQGIYALEFDNGTLSEARVFCGLQNAKYLTATGNYIAAVCDLGDKSGAALIGSDGLIRSSVAFENCASCFITASGEYLYTANYHAGTVSRLSISGETIHMKNTVQIRDKAGCHQVLIWGEYLLVPCLLLDCVAVLDGDFKIVKTIPFPKGTGPRHGVFSADGSILYLVSELSDELYVLEVGSWKTIFKMSVLPNGITHRDGTAAIRLNRAGNRLYITVRGSDVISVIALDGASPRLIQTVPCGGKHPRDMILLDNHILTANRFTNSVAAFEIRKDGTIGERTGEATVPGVVCLTAE